MQFKIIHNITNCRENLKRWNLANDEICEFCDLKINDNLKHSLFEREFSKIIINEVFQQLSFKKERILQIQCEEFIFGVEDSALNLVFVIKKKRLIEARTYKGKMSINSIENEILKRIYVDRMKMNTCKFRRKWDNFPELVNMSSDYFENGSFQKLMNISSCFVFQEIDLCILCMCMYIISGDMYYVIVLYFIVCILLNVKLNKNAPNKKIVSNLLVSSLVKHLIQYVLYRPGSK